MLYPCRQIHRPYSTTYSNLMVTVNNADTTFAPYSNICPISGRTSATVTRTGKNLYNPQTANDGKILWEGGTLATNAQMTTSDFIKVRAGKIYVQNALPASVGRTCAI